MSVDVKITTRGGLFTSGARIVADGARDMERTLANEGADLVERHLSSSMMRPTGRYLRSLTVRTNARSAEFADGGIVYGPWLEGTSSRNQRSRFKGYSAFRRATQQVERNGERLLQADVMRMIARLS